MQYEAPKFNEKDNPNIPHDTNHWRELRTMLVYLAITVAAVWALIEAIVQTLPYTVSLPREKQWFGFVGKEIAAGQNAHPDPKITALATRLGKRMNLPDTLITVYISEEAVPNAYATFGGNVVLYRSLLNELPSEEAVATVLAHEMAHIKHRDPLRSMSRGVLYSAVAALFGSETQMHALAGIGSLKYSRDMERAADSAAIEAVAQEYGSVGGAVQLFDALEKVQQKYHAGNGIAWLSTHPDTRERQANVARIAKQSGFPSTAAKLPNIWQSKQPDAP